ncbi:uncharacterized protein LOC107858893 isoform X2 [Capsicum annuum]|uniref:uncharacterized protein LOC107858893 isoform X2 n=1 Tax=Capsicum annuum TaxID=4072 RepID=UPI001FB0F920|nr:uncharacterized protein LOC107858893 isoform X2 [Capsicum annuum]
MTLLPGSSCAVVLQQAIGLSLKSKSSFKIQVTLLPARLWLEPRWASLHNVVAARKGEDTWDVFCMKDISSLSILLGVQEPDILILLLSDWISNQLVLD